MKNTTPNKYLIAAQIVLLFFTVLQARAEEKMPAWMLIQDAPFAYTLPEWYGEIAISYLAVNDTLDIFNIRDEITSGNSLLNGNIGDLDGWHGIINFGFPKDITCFWRGKQTTITTTLGSTSLFGDLTSDETLKTSGHTLGIRWQLPVTPFDRSVVSLEASLIQNSSDDYAINFTQIDDGKTILSFLDPEEIRLSQLSDDGWQMRILFSGKFGENSAWTAWVGYADYSAEAEVSTTISYKPIKNNFDRLFNISEKQVQAGIGLNWQITPNITSQLFYEYRDVDRSENDSGTINTSVLARYTNPEELSSERTNHIFSGKIGYWFTDYLNMTVSGQIMTNQFLGLIPHYNTPLTNRFFDQLYGYAGFGLNYIFSF